MADQVTFIVGALRQEARKWRGLSGEMTPIVSAVKGLSLEASAFFIGDMNTITYTRVYGEYQQFMATILDDAATEFEKIGSVLDKTADVYERNEEVIEIDLNQVYRK